MMGTRSCAPSSYSCCGKESKRYLLIVGRALFTALIPSAVVDLLIEALRVATSIPLHNIFSDGYVQPTLSQR